MIYKKKREKNNHKTSIPFNHIHLAWIAKFDVKIRKGTTSIIQSLMNTKRSSITAEQYEWN